MSVEVMGTKSRAERGYGDDMERELSLSSIRVEELRSKCSGSDGMADGCVWIIDNPDGFETVYHALTSGSTSMITGVVVVVIGVSAWMGWSEGLEVEGPLSPFSNIRDRLLGVREGPVAEGVPGERDIC